MKLWLIYSNKHENNPFVPKLMQDACIRAGGIDSFIFYSEYFSFYEANGKSELFYKGLNINDELPDAVLCRCYNYDIIEFFESKNIKVFNSCNAMKIVRDKFKTHKFASHLQIPQPRTIKGNLSFHQIKQYLDIPFVMKDNYGEKGSYVYLIDSENYFNNIKETYQTKDFIYQEYISFSKGIDYRLYVVGNEVLTVIKREASNQSFLSNISLGGVGTVVKVPNYLKKQAVELANHIGLDLCSVDFLKNKNEYLLCEVNGNCGFEACLKNNIDLPLMYINYIKKNMKSEK